MKTTVFPVVCFSLLMGLMLNLPLRAKQRGVLLAAAATDGAPNGDAAPQNQADAETYTGKIISMNGQYFVLRDDANQTWYHLDDQAKARAFFGKNVSVKGVLDGRTDVIHVRSIEEQ
jgi:hypothetical protein